MGSFCINIINSDETSSADRLDCIFLQGTGIMTVRMLQQAKKVIAVELDPRMVRCHSVQFSPLCVPLILIFKTFYIRPPTVRKHKGC